ncbi:hypothetical protein DEO72_LG9g3634 [Vigna unguiculata]|uniref:Cotton fiber protein n=1 Tax=Vigna unguiculata TaxID=3917 RepID=A0A4D6N8X9_VIGUN|nr:hypothetical protein DEO72_LG9g3634 [Vigna unguiculata]
MPRKASPFFHKLSLHLLRLSLLLHRLRKPIFPKLLKRFKKCQELKLLKHSDYGDYQFSASTTPLIPRYRRNQFKNSVQPGLCSFLYLFWCLGNFNVERSGERQLALEPFEIGDETSLAQDLFECGSGDDEGESVDQKAEKFIQNFYHQMRMQRQESL